MAAFTVEPAVSLRNVSKSYRMGDVVVRALKPTDLDLNRGEVVVILGPSGSGKTTILNLVGGLDRPTGGEIRVGGIDVHNLDTKGLTAFRRDNVGFVFQFFNLVPSLTALENVQFAGELVRDPMDPREVLDAVGLGERADHFPAEMSGGEQQRVAIARALVKDPLILLADEPTGALDMETGTRILALMKDTAARRDKTVVIVTHNSAISRMADRIVRLRDGEVVDDERIENPVSALDLRW